MPSPAFEMQPMHGAYPLQPELGDLNTYPSQNPYPSQNSAYASMLTDASVNFGANAVPIASFAHTGGGSWQPPPQPPGGHYAPFTPAANPPPFLRQGIASSMAVSSSSSGVSVSGSARPKLELPPLPRPLSSAAAALEPQDEIKQEFKPAV